MENLDNADDTKISQDDTQHKFDPLFWLPKKMPKGVWLIATVTPKGRVLQNCETTTDHSWKILRLKTDLSTKTRKEIISKYLVHHGLYAAESWIQDILTSEMTSRHKYLAVLLESLLSLKVFPSMFLHTQTKEDYESGDGALAACVNRKNNQPPVGLVEDSTLALHGLDPKYEAQVHAPSIRLNINNLLSESQHPTQLWEQWLKNLNKRTPLLREALCRLPKCTAISLNK